MATVEAERLRAIIDAQALISASSAEPVEVMQIVAEQSARLTGAIGAVVETSTGGTMTRVAAAGVAAGRPGGRFEATAGFADAAWRANKVLRCDDAEVDSRVDRDACRVVGVRSIVAVPVRRGHDAVGVLEVLADGAGRFSDDDVSALELLAGFISASLGQGAALSDARRDVLEDPLTGLANRVLLIDRINLALARARRGTGLVVVVSVDVTGTRSLPPRSAATGDRILRAVAERLRHCARPTDTIARLDEGRFAVVFDGVRDELTAARLVGRLTSAIVAPIPVDDDLAIEVPAGVGVAVSDGAIDPEALLDEADRSRERAARAGVHGR